MLSAWAVSVSIVRGKRASHTNFFEQSSIALRGRTACAEGVRVPRKARSKNRLRKASAWSDSEVCRDDLPLNTGTTAAGLNGI